MSETFEFPARIDSGGYVLRFEGMNEDGTASYAYEAPDPLGCGVLVCNTIFTEDEIREHAALCKETGGGE